MNLFKRLAFQLLFLMPLLLSPEAKSQSAVLKVITDRFQKYVRDYPWEDVFIHTDRSEYISGEQLWFSAYVIDRQRNKPSDASRIVYVELLNSSNSPIVRKRVSALKGSGSGEMYLPDTLATGNYFIRAYTSSMKNFLPENCFTMELNIYNAITTKNNTTILKRKEAGTSALLRESNYQSSSISGFNPELIQFTGDTLGFLITTDENFRSANRNSCLIFIHTRGNINYSGTVSLPGAKTRYYVPGSLLMPGINHITFFDSNGQPISEKYLFNRFRMDQAFLPDVKDSFSRREKVSIGLSLPVADEESFLHANLSFSAVPYAGKAEEQDLTGYLVLGSEFGQLPDEIVFSNIDTLQGNDLGNTIPGIKSRWINWSAILSDTEQTMKYPAEKEDHYISGRLVSKESGLPVAGEYLFLSIPGKNAIFQYSRTDKGGNFIFSVPVSDAVNDIIIQPETVDKDYSVELISTFAEPGKPENLIESTSENEVPGYIYRWGANYQVNRIYGISNTKITETPPVGLPEPRRFYGKPDISILMDDYIKLPVMDEVFFELIPGVSMKTRRSKTEIILIGSSEYLTYSKPPVLMIDGVIISDAALIANLDPEIVEKIDVNRERYIVGDYIFYGLVNVITRAGDFSNVTLPDYAVRLKYKVFDPVLTFSFPDYSAVNTGPDKTPDFRNTLYWNPSVKPSKDGKVSVEFWTSDLPGDYVINIQGFSGDGKPVSIRKIITVR